MRIQKNLFGDGVYEKKKLQSPDSVGYFIAICWLAYFSTYLGRLNYSASMNDIVQTGFLTKPEAGMIGTGFFFCYGFGQMISGILGDRIPSRWMEFAGIAGSALVNLLMFITYDRSVMLFLWCLNGFTQSLAWAPIVKILSDRLTAEKCRKACIFMSTTSVAGTLAAYLLAAFVIGLSNWRNVFLTSSAFLLIVSFIWLISIGKIEKTAEREGVIEKVTAGTGITNTEKVNLWRLFLLLGLIPVFFCIVIQGILKDGVTTWVPTYISEMFHLGSVTSILATTLLPVINLGGVYAANYLNNRYFKNEIKTSGFCFVVASVSLLFLMLIGKYQVILAIILLALTTTGMIGVNTMLISLVPLYFARIGKVSTVTGILNSLAYAGSAVSSFGIGVVAEQYGWNITIIMWFTLAIIGAFICILLKDLWVKKREELL
jgi:OPA family glycerol-3-phosphate transporter-like MFS transporter